MSVLVYFHLPGEAAEGVTGVVTSKLLELYVRFGVQCAESMCSCNRMYSKMLLYRWSRQSNVVRSALEGSHPCSLQKKYETVPVINHGARGSREVLEDYNHVECSGTGIICVQFSISSHRCCRSYMCHFTSCSNLVFLGLELR